MKDDAYEVRMTYIGRGKYQCFIENIDSTAHYARIIFGFVRPNHMGRNIRTAHILNRCVVTMVNPGSGTFLREVDVLDVLKHRVRFWVLIQAVERQPKHRPGKPVAHFVGLSPPAYRWRKSIGASSRFVMKAISDIAYEELHLSNHLVEAAVNKKLS